MKVLFINISIDLIDTNHSQENFIKDELYNDLKYYYQKIGIVPEVILEQKGDSLKLKSRKHFFYIAKEVGVKNIDAILYYDDEKIISKMIDSGHLKEISLQDMKKKEGHPVEDWKLYIFFYEEPLNKNNISWLKTEVSNFFSKYKPILKGDIIYKTRDFLYLEENNIFEFYAYYSTNPDDRQSMINFGKFLLQIQNYKKMRSVNGIAIDVLLP